MDSNSEKSRIKKEEEIAPDMFMAKHIRLKRSDYDTLVKQLIFTPISNTNKKDTMKTVLHKADTRGHANHGWLDSYHSFSFADYHNPERMHFGVLRVLNDDRVAPARGFGTHPHDNMEIISIPLEGDLEHKDSLGNVTVIKEGDIQVMSAGTGVFHSEYNKNADREVRFLQIWLFPNQKDMIPRYDQAFIKDLAKDNSLYQILSPNADDSGVWIHQNAWFHMGDLRADTTHSYDLKQQDNGVYIFILEGETKVEGRKLGKRDGFGVWNTTKIHIKTLTDTKVLLMEVPMNL